MNKGSRKAIIKVISMLIIVEGIAMIFSAAFSMSFEEWEAAKALGYTGTLIGILGLLVQFSYKFEKAKLGSRDGFLIAVISWFVVSILGAFPFYFCGMDYSFVGSVFESVSGFTTTGSTVFDMDMMPKGIIMWKSVSHWLGGMGILVLVISVLPGLSKSGSMSYVESSGPMLQKVGTKYTDTTKFLYITYVSFTLIEFLLLLAGPLDVFDALTNAFSSISTGGLMVTSSNRIAFRSVYVRVVILVFTIISSINYTLYHTAFKGKLKSFFMNTEVKVFISIIAISSVLIALDLRFAGHYRSFWQAYKDGLCQVVSFISTAGYYVCDYNRWPSFAVVVLFSLLLIGGCSMSTSGSLKVFRVVTLFKLIARGIFQKVHPRAVKAVVINKKAVPAVTVSEISTHIMLFFCVLFVSAAVLSLDNLDMTTTFTTALAVFTNTGLMLGPDGSSGYLGMFSDVSQIYMCFLMIAGRLEMYTLLIIFTKGFWKEDKAF